MSRVHVLDGLGLDAALRAVQRQAVLWYPTRRARDLDLLEPWPGATTLYPDGAGVLVLESWDGGAWRALGADGGGGAAPGVTDHGALTGLGDDDHPQYLTAARGDALFLTPAEGNAAIVTHEAAANPHAGYLTPAEVVAGANVTVDRTTTPGSVIVAATATTPAGIQRQGYVRDSAISATVSPWAKLYTLPATLRANAVAKVSVRFTVGFGIAAITLNKIDVYTDQYQNANTAVAIVSPLPLWTTALTGGTWYQMGEVSLWWPIPTAGTAPTFVARIAFTTSQNCYGQIEYQYSIFDPV